MKEKTYTCICGTVCNSPAAFNGHKQGCKEHIINKYGSLEAYYEIKNRNHDRGKKLRERSNLNKETKHNQWVSEHHTCEKCGKVMTEKWGSGRFCSASCANGRPKSPEERAKIGKGVVSHVEDLRIHSQDIRTRNIVAYELDPQHCTICGSILSYDDRIRKTCSIECENEYHRIFRNEYIAEHGIVEHGKKGYRYGWYKGYHCDSSWELAYLMYHLDNNISIERNNNKFFEYQYEGRVHKFFPDFIIDNTFIEIKGMDSEQCQAKVRDFPADVSFKILFYEEIKPYLEYAESTYGKEFFTLYDEDKPSWMSSS